MRRNLNLTVQIQSPGQKSLLVDLSPHGSQILRGSQVLLWLPLSWLTKSSHFKRRKNFLVRNSNLIGARGNISMIPATYCLLLDGWFGVDVTRLSRRSIRKGRTYLELQDLHEEFYIQTAFLQIVTGFKGKVGRRRRPWSKDLYLHFLLSGEGKREGERRH